MQAFAKSQAYIPIIRMQLFQGALNRPEISAMTDLLITMDLQFHSKLQGCFLNTFTSKLHRN